MPSWVVHVAVEVCVVGALSLYLNGRINDVEKRFAGLNDYLLREWQTWTREHHQASAQSRPLTPPPPAPAPAPAPAPPMRTLASKEDRERVARMEHELSALRKQCMYLVHQNSEFQARLDRLESSNLESIAEVDETEGAESPLRDADTPDRARGVTIEEKDVSDSDIADELQELADE